MLIYTGFPGYYGVDEEDSEATLGFWYLLQESLWEVVESGNDDEDALDWAAMVNAESDFAVREAVRSLEGEAQMVEDDDGPGPRLINDEEDAKGQGETAKATKEPDMAQLLFAEVVNVLRRKVTWPKKSEIVDSGAWDAG
jgi:hypothetical protein